MSARRGGRYGARGERGPQGPKHRAEEEYVPPEHIVLTWQEEKLLEERFEAGRGETPPEPRPGSYADYLEQELEAAYQAERRRILAEEIWRERERKEQEREMAKATDEWLMKTGQASVSEVEGAVGGEEESTLLITILNPPREARKEEPQLSGATVGVSALRTTGEEKEEEMEEGEIESESEERRESEKAEKELEEVLEGGGNLERKGEGRTGANSRGSHGSNIQKRKAPNPRRQWTMDDYVSVVDPPRPKRSVSPQHPRPSSLSRRRQGEDGRERIRSHSRGSHLPVKTRGAIFGGLEEIPTNPRIDPPPHTCYNCWQPGHVRGQCTREVRHTFCYNCGRRGESLNSCPRCSRAREALLQERARGTQETRRRSILRTPGSHERSRSRGGARSSSGRRVRWESPSPPRTSARQPRGRARSRGSGSASIQEVIHLAEQIRTLPPDLQEALLRMANPEDSSRANPRRRPREGK